MSKSYAPVAVFDLDGTLTRSDTYVKFLLHVLRRRPHKAVRLPALAIDVARHKLGKQSNTWLKKRFLSALLSGHHRTSLESWAHSFSHKIIRNNLYSDGLDRLSYHIDQGHEVVLLSASLDLYVKMIGEALGFHQVICTETSWNNDILGTDLASGNCYGENKLKRLQNWLDQTPGKTVDTAYGDHVTDFPVLQSAKQGFVINPDTKLEKQAKANALSVLMWS